MNPAESVRAFQVSGAEFALGHHYGTFQLTDEAIDAPVEALEAARVDAGIDPEQFRLLSRVRSGTSKRGLMALTLRRARIADREPRPG